MLDNDLNLDYEVPHISNNHTRLIPLDLPLSLSNQNMLHLQPNLIDHHHHLTQTITNILDHYPHHRMEYNLNISLDSNDADKANLSDDSCNPSTSSSRNDLKI